MKKKDTYSPYGVDLFGDVIRPDVSGIIADRFIVPPFSILDAKQGSWQRRKRAWKNIGLKSEIGRSAECNAKSLRPLTGDRDRLLDKGTSIFDPVLCELAYSWFCPPNGQIIDPFAGGSVRGIVAGAMGYDYWGCDLSDLQVEANIDQSKAIKTDKSPKWIVGDSIVELSKAPDADFIFSCPPYGNLEVYSDDPRDISTMEYHTFKAAYGRIILKAVKKMKPNSFACFVVGDFRCAKGFYRNFVSDTINAFEMSGAKLYNDAILATPLGNAAMRAAAFDKGRKLVKVHQNILVFCKGDCKIASGKTTKH